MKSRQGHCKRGNLQDGLAYEPRCSNSKFSVNWIEQNIKKL